MKDDLWDLLITMPLPHTINSKEKIWPTVESPKGVPVKATQRDLRRFRALKIALGRLAAAGDAVDDNEGDGENEETIRPANRASRISTPSIRTNSLMPDGDDALVLADAAEKIVEPMTWAALAYSGFMWWASAGEQRRSDEAEEQAHDNSLIADLMPAPTMHQPAPGQQKQRRPSGSFNVTAVQGGDSITSLTARRSTTVDGLIPVCGGEEEEERAKTELAVITYFHRLTAGILSTLADIVEAAEEDEWLPHEDGPQDVVEGEGEGEGEGEAEREGEAEGEEESDTLLPTGTRSDQQEEEAVPRAPVRVDSDALAAMGLDIWSDADAEFVRQGVSKYFNREAKVEGKGVELCGLRVC